MRAEILSVGTELLVGSIVNTNAQYVSRRLAEHAVDVYRQVTVGDNAGRLVECLREAASRADLIVTSGGLGPTEDDVTVSAVAKALGKRLVVDRLTLERLRRRVKNRGLKMTKLLERQCRVPEGAIVFKNHHGTAPGTLSEWRRGRRSTWILSLPGPPREMEPMFEEALPRWKREARAPDEAFVIRSVRLAEVLESQVAPKVGDLLRRKPPVTVGIYAHGGEVELKIMSKHKNARRAAAEADKIEARIRRIFGKDVFGTDGDTLASVVGGLLRKKGATLAASESCTGGLFASLVTDMPGSSDYFLGAAVAYANEVKSAVLGVPAGLLRRHGAVSGPVAAALAVGACRKFSADYGVGITGVAGPSGGSPGKPVGWVHFAIAERGRVVVRDRHLFLEKTRAEIKARAARRALDILRRVLLSSK